MTNGRRIRDGNTTNLAKGAEAPARAVKSSRPKLSVVVPTRNEAGNIEELVARIERAVDGGPTEVIFVDDSIDETPAVIGDVSGRCRLPVSLIHRPPEGRADGLAGAVVLGLRSAAGRWVCVMDADLQHPPELIGELLASGESGEADVVIASRYLPGASADGLGSKSRKMISLFAKWASKALFFDRLRRISDPLAGFFLVRRELLNEAELRPVGFKILLEILMRTSWQRSEEVPYSFARRADGASKATFTQGINFLKHLARLWFEVPSAGRFWKFALIGASGAVVNLALLSVLVVLMELNRWLGWAIAVEGSVLWNFLLAKNFAWADRQSPAGSQLRELSSYHAVAGIGLCANALVFASLALLNAHVLLAGFLGILAGIITNYGGFDRLVFRAAASPPQRRMGAWEPQLLASTDDGGIGTLRRGISLSGQFDGEERRCGTVAGGALDGLLGSGGTRHGLKASINLVIQAELKHIPRADRGSTQNELRMLYNFHRRRQLAIDPDAPPGQALLAAMQTLRGDLEVFSPLYDRDFFLLGHSDGRRHVEKEAT